MAAAVKGADVQVLEAKLNLNRNVLGQVEVGMALLGRDFAPRSVVGVAVCANGNADLEWYCAERRIHTAVYGDVASPRKKGKRILPDGRVDVRKPPDLRRRQAFLGGWDRAVAGHPFSSVRTKKTHANMGNLFGWIYGDQPPEFRHETWARYVKSLRANTAEAS